MRSDERQKCNMKFGTACHDLKNETNHRGFDQRSAQVPFHRWPQVGTNSPGTLVKLQGQPVGPGPFPQSVDPPTSATFSRGSQQKISRMIKNSSRCWPTPKQKPRRQADLTKMRAESLV